MLGLKKARLGLAQNAMMGNWLFCVPKKLANVSSAAQTTSKRQMQRYFSAASKRRDKAVEQPLQKLRVAR